MVTSVNPFDEVAERIETMDQTLKRLREMQPHVSEWYEERLRKAAMLAYQPKVTRGSLDVLIEVFVGRPEISLSRVRLFKRMYGGRESILIKNWRSTEESRWSEKDHERIVREEFPNFDRDETMRKMCSNTRVLFYGLLTLLQED